MKQLEKALIQLKISYSKETLEHFSAYQSKLLEWNKMVNMTSIVDSDMFIKKHYIDSLVCAASDEFLQAERVVDIGTGGGFPGIPLALIAPEKDFILVDSLKKRLKIIETICEEMGIHNVTVIHGRAEDLGRSKIHREKYDLCVSRAVANLNVLLEYCLPLVRKNGYFLAYKGPDGLQELDDSKSVISVLGGKFVRAEQVDIKDYDLDHNILYIKKERQTPSKYPRKAGMPSKDPLK